MFSIHAWSESISTATEDALSGVADQTIRVDGDNLYIGSLNQLVAAYGVGDTASYIRLESPSLRDIANFEVSSVDENSVATTPLATSRRFNSPISLTTGEGLECYGYQTSGGAAQVTALAWLSDGTLAPVTGEIHTVQFEVTVSGTANEWENNALSFTQTLPQGSYQVVGARLENTNGFAFRFVPIGQAGVRPGGLSVEANNEVVVPFQRMGNLGVWFEFDNDTPPTIDVLEDGTGGTYTGYLDIIKSA